MPPLASENIEETPVGNMGGSTAGVGKETPPTGPTIAARRCHHRATSLVLPPTTAIDGRPCVMRSCCQSFPPPPSSAVYEEEKREAARRRKEIHGAQQPYTTGHHREERSHYVHATTCVGKHRGNAVGNMGGSTAGVGKETPPTGPTIAARRCHHRATSLVLPPTTAIDGRPCVMRSCCQSFPPPPSSAVYEEEKREAARRRKEIHGAKNVPESVLKKQKRQEEWALAKKQDIDAIKKKNAENRKIIFNRAKQYAKEYEEQQKELIQLKREARLKGGFYVNPEAKLLFIIRIRGINAMHPQTKKIFAASLRLRQIFNGVFLKGQQSNNQHVAQG
nr:60S ribosomal protein L7-2 [Ipomoea batatas]